MTQQHQTPDPRYTRTPPFKIGETVYMKDGSWFHVRAIYWNLDHNQWSGDFFDPDTDKELADRNLCGLMSKREFFTRRVAA